MNWPGHLPWKEIKTIIEYLDGAAIGEHGGNNMRTVEAPTDDRHMIPKPTISRL
jgi:hypothetical protein